MMHLSMEIRSGSTVRTSINFNLNGYAVLDGYYPETSDDVRVVDQFDVLVKGSSESDLQGKVQAVELALAFARDHQNGPDGVWILFSANDATLADYQSRVSGGTVMFDSKLSKRWKEMKARISVVVERMPWWESSTAVTLTVDNSGGSPGNTAGVLNHQDAGTGHDFYVEIAADQVTGGLPTPAIIEFKNTTNDARTIDNLFAGHFAASGALDPPDATDLILEGSGEADADCSGGSYAALTWSDENESQIDSWSLATIDFRQRNYRFLARFQASFVYTDLWLKVKLLSGSIVLSETHWALMEAGQFLQSIGSLKIPPFRHGNYVDIGDLTVGLYEKRAAGAGSANLDYIAMMPQNSWRKFGAISGLAYNETLIDNPVEETLVTLYSTASYKVTHNVEEGVPIMLQPGVKNLLYFLHDCDNATAAIARTATVGIKCHPRRKSV